MNITIPISAFALSNQPGVNVAKEVWSAIRGHYNCENKYETFVGATIVTREGDVGVIVNEEPSTSEYGEIAYYSYETRYTYRLNLLCEMAKDIHDKDGKKVKIFLPEFDIK